MLRLLQAKTINRYIQTFQVTKILNQRLIKNQLPALPLTGLPQMLKSIFSILLSLRGRLIPTSDQQPFSVWVLPEKATDDRLLFLEFLAFSCLWGFFCLFSLFCLFLFPMVHCQNPSSHSSSCEWRSSHPDAPLLRQTTSHHFLFAFFPW